MIKQIIKRNFKLIILFNIIVLNCYGSNVTENYENFSDAKQISIHQPMDNDEYYKIIGNLYLETNETEVINIQTHPAQWPSSDDLNFLRYYLPTNTTLKSLTLNNCDLTHTDANYIWDALRHNFNCSLETLDLSHNELCHQDINEPYSDLGASFGPAMQTTETLRKLYLDDINLGSWHISSVAAAFSVNTSTSILSLKSNKIEDFGAMQLSKMLTLNQSLETLDLSYNNITKYGLKELIFGLKSNTNLKELILTGNRFTKSDIVVLGVAGKNKIIKF